MNRHAPFFIIITAIIATVAVGGIVGGESHPPGEPAHFYGDVVDDDGNPAPDGTLIVSVVDGDVEAEITVDTSGEYGEEDPFGEKLTLDSNVGDEMYFYVDGPDGQESLESPVSLEAGTHEKSLTFPSGTFPEPEADETDPSAPADEPEPAPDDTTEEQAEDPPEDTTDGTTDDTLEDEDVHPDEESDDAIRESGIADIEVDAETGKSTARVEGNTVTEIRFDSDSIEGAVSVTEYDREPDHLDPSPGTTVSVTQISVPDDATDQSGTISVSVDRDHIDEIDGDPDDATLARYVDDKWEPLETDRRVENGSVHLDAAVPGFSYYSVTLIANPVADVTVSPADITVGESFTLDGSGSEDKYGEIVAYEWTVGDEQLTGETISTEIDEPGELTIELEVTNDAGLTDSVSETIEIVADDGEASTDVEDSRTEPQADRTPGFSIGLTIMLILSVMGIASYTRQ